MKEGKIILPLMDNQGNPLDAVHSGLRGSLAKAFGGWTATQAMGGWVGDDLQEEPVTVYTVAGDAIDNDTLGQIAKTYGQAALQKTVYWTGFDGFTRIDKVAA